MGKGVEGRMETKQALALALLTSAIIVTLINGPLTIVKEMTPLKAALRAAFGHHWVGHSVILFIVFLVLTIALIPVYRGRGFTARLFTRMALLLAVSVAIMLVLILGFYLIEFFA